MQRYDTDHLNRIQFKQSYFCRCHASFEYPHRYITNKYFNNTLYYIYYCFYTYK